MYIYYLYIHYIIKYNNAISIRNFIYTYTHAKKGNNNYYTTEKKKQQQRVTPYIIINKYSCTIHQVFLCLYKKKKNNKISLVNY